jgi:hypothetical protein
MNKQFVIKILQAKQLQYEALKEIIPEPMVTRITKIEDELLELGKEYFMTAGCRTQNEEHTGQTGTKTKTKAHKVTIE